MVDHREKEARDRREREKRAAEPESETDRERHSAIWTYRGKKYITLRSVRLYGFTGSELMGVTVLLPELCGARNEMD